MGQLLSHSERKLVEWIELLQSRKSIEYHYETMPVAQTDSLIEFVRREFGVALTTEAVRSQSSIGELATFIDLLINVSLKNKQVPVRSHQTKGILSHSQNRLYLAHHIERPQLYNMPFQFEIKGFVEPDLMRLALKELMDRHEILRTYFSDDLLNKQIVSPNVDTPFYFEDLRVMGQAEATLRLENQWRREMDKEFNLKEGPLLQVNLFHLEENYYSLICNFHHIIFDGVSLNLFFNEWLQIYEHLKGKITTPIAALPMQYLDFVDWQTKLISEQEEKQNAFWQNLLNHEEEVLALPHDFIRPNEPSFTGGQIRVTLPESLNLSITSFIKNNNTTLFMFMMTAYQVFLTRYLGKQEIVVGSTVANRQEEAFVNSIGCFINMLPYKLTVSENETFVDILARNRARMLDVLENQHYPINKIVEAVNPDRKLSSTPLFQTVLAMEDHFDTHFHNSYFTVNKQDIPIPFSNYDLTMKVKKNNNVLTLEGEYAKDLFKEETISNLLNSFKEWLFQLCKYSKNPISELRYMDVLQEEKTLQLWQGKKVMISPEETIISRFHEVATEYKNKIAICDGVETITYGQLDQLSTIIANHVRDLNVQGTENMVGLHIERSINMVASMLGILKAGCGYVPLDPALPDERLSYIIADAELNISVTNARFNNRIKKAVSHIVNVDQLNIESHLNEREANSGSQLAYTIYTSGTTGKPKGVMLTHQGIINLVISQRKFLHLNESSKVLQFATFNFDASVYEIFGSLLNGAELHIGNNKERMFDSFELEKQIVDQGITHIVLPPAVLQELDLTGSNVQFVGSAGSECPPELIEKYKDAHFYNAYGPTEYSVWTTFKIFPPHNGLMENVSPIVIGRPILNTKIYVLNDHLKPAPIGSAGELYIGGFGIAAGYCNKKELTAQSFVQNPFSANERLYKSGDLVKWNQEGDLVFLGRKDQQVKIRGFRIELNEVAVQIEKCPDVTGVHMNIYEPTSFTKQMIAYFTATKLLDSNEMKRMLRKAVPDYLIPSFFIQVDQFPLTINGKIDSAQLPNPVGENVEKETEPSNMKEAMLLRIFKQILGIEQIRRTDNFFDLGGDSIQSIQICSLARQEGLPLTPKLIFEHQTIRELAASIKVESITTVGPIKVEGDIELTPIQRWFFENHEVKLHHWNQSIVFYKTHCPPIEQIQTIIQQLIKRHTGLTTLFKRRNKSFIGNSNRNHSTFELDYREFTSNVGTYLQMWRDSHEEITQASLNLFEGPIMKMVIMKEEENRYRFFWVIHHLLIDTVSWGILLDDFNKLFTQQTVEGSKEALPACTSSYNDWSLFLNEYRASINEKTINYWRKKTACVADELDVNPVMGEEKESIWETTLSIDETTTFVHTTTEESKSTVAELLLALVSKSVADVFQLNRLWINMEGHGREFINEKIDITRTVGWFTVMYPVYICTGEDFFHTLSNTKEAIREIPNNGFDYGLLKYADEEILIEPNVSVTFNYLGKIDENMYFSNSADFFEVEKEDKIHFLAFIQGEQLTLKIISKLNKDKGTQLINELKAVFSRAIQSEDVMPSLVKSDFPDAHITDEDLQFILGSNKRNESGKIG